MNKKILILPLVAFAMIGCGGSNPGGGGQGGGGGGEVTRDGKTIETAFTAEEAWNLMEAAGSGKIVGTDQQYYVTGVFDAGTSVNTTYHQWYGTTTIGSKIFKVSGATNDSGTTVTEADGNLDGATFVVKGFLELYNGEYKVGFLPATSSPTGQKFVPSLVKLSNVKGGGDTPTPSGGGIAGANASATGSKTGTKLTFDFTGGTISGITATSSSDPQSSGTATVDSYQFAFANAIAHTASAYVETGYLGLCTTTPKAVASFANITAIPGKITAIEITMPKEKSSGSVSAIAPLIVDLGTSALGSTTLTGGQTGGSEAVLTAYAVSGFTGSYFSVSCVQGVNTSGKAAWKNACIASISVWYN